jgi:hypothetical protein
MVAAVQGPENVPNTTPQSSLASMKVPEAKTPDVIKPNAPSKAATTADKVGTVGEHSYEANTQSMAPGADAATQATRIMSQDSPLMQLAKQQGLLTAARRGLGNSSIAAGASQAEAAKAATPFALQNAQQEQQQSLANQAALNTAASENTRIAQSSDVFNVGEGNKAVAQDAAATNQFTTQHNETLRSGRELDAKLNADAAMQKHSTDSDMNKTWTSGEISARLAAISGEYNELIQSNASAASIMTSTNDAIAAIWSNSEIPVATKTAQAQSLIGWSENSLKVLGSISGMTFRTDLG